MVTLRPNLLQVSSRSRSDTCPRLRPVWECPVKSSSDPAPVLRAFPFVSPLARSYTDSLQKSERRRLFSSPTGFMEQGSAPMATLGCTGSELPGQGCCRSWRQAASLVVVGRMRGGERCHRTISVARQHRAVFPIRLSLSLSCRWCHMYVTNHKLYWSHHLPLGRRWASIAQRVLKVTKDMVGTSSSRWRKHGSGKWPKALRSPRAMMAGGRAMLPTLGAALQQQLWHRSLPPPLLPICQQPDGVLLWRHLDFLNHFVRFDLLADSNDPHIVWKLLMRLNRWAWRCDRAR